MYRAGSNSNKSSETNKQTNAGRYTRRIVLSQDKYRIKYEYEDWKDQHSVSLNRVGMTTPDTA